jgi:hypothetical protein
MSQKTKVFSVSELLKNLNKVSFSELKKQKSGGYVSWVNYNLNGSLKRIFVRVPKMFAPFGASSYNDAPNKFQIALSFKNENENTEVADLKKLLAKLDKLVLDKTYKEKNGQKNIKKYLAKISIKILLKLLKKVRMRINMLICLI